MRRASLRGATLRRMPTLPDGSGIRALLLDLDDTILDGRSGVAAAWDAVSALVAAAQPGLADADVRLEIDRVTDWFWSDPERHRTGRLDLVAARRVILTRVLAVFEREEPALVERAARFYTEHREASLCLEEGVLEVLEGLRARVPRMALVTNGAARPQRAKVERFALERFFDHVQIEGELGVGKPETRAYEHALGVLDARPGEALMVGDNFECDVLGPLEAGMHAAWIDLHDVGEPPEPAPRSFHRVRSLRELAELLEP